jgi:excisionase family DNA binding protein
MERKLNEAIKLVEKEFMTVQEVATHRKVTRIAIYDLIKRGRLPFHTILGKTVVRKSDLDSFIKEK